MRESNKRLLASEQKAREDNTRLRSHAKYLAAERDKWRQECQKQIDETMELVDQKDEAVREAEKQRNQFEVELALCRRDYQTRMEAMEPAQLEQSQPRVLSDPHYTDSEDAVDVLNQTQMEESSKETKNDDLDQQPHLSSRSQLSRTSRRAADQDRKEGTQETEVERTKWSARQMFLTSPSLVEGE